jgi:type VI secretion system secreted protein Hcp
MKRSSLITFLAPLVIASSLSAASVDYLLEIDGIKGESSDDRYPEAIEVSSFSWGAGNTGASGGGGGAGKVTLQDFHFMAKSSKASPKLFLACATGQHIGEAVLHIRKAGATGQPQEYFVVKLKPVYITSYQTGGSSSDSDDRPTEEVAFYYDTISIVHIADDGTTTTGEATRTPVAPQ